MLAAIASPYAWREKLKLTADLSHEQERMQATSLELQAPEADACGHSADSNMKIVGFG